MDFALGEKSLFEATSFVQRLVADPRSDTGLALEELEDVLRRARAGCPGYDLKAREVVRGLMERYGLTVAGMDIDRAAEEIYAYLWGLDVVEKLYRSPEVDEVRVNGPDRVYCQERGRSRRAEVRFKDEEHVSKIIARLLEHDRASLDEGSPGAESRRLDGSRLTALTYPVTRGPCFVLRKHGTFDISDENYVASGTMDRRAQRLLSLLVRGRANVLVAGDANTGKTTLLRWLARFLHPALRIVTIETDRELLLDEWYPDRDIVSLEAHPEVGWDMRRCFVAALRLSPDVIMVGEARGLGEAGQMINACLSGHHGSMGTIHAYSAREAVGVLAQMALEEGRRLPVSVLEDQVASAFDVVVQMYGSAVTGTRRVERIVEVWRGKEGPEFMDLCVWRPSGESYEEGSWAYPHGISERLRAKLFRYGVKREELKQLEELMGDG